MVVVVGWIGDGRGIRERGRAWDKLIFGYRGLVGKGAYLMPWLKQPG